MLISQCYFDGPPLELMGPLLGPQKPTAFLKPMGPLKSMGPNVIVPPSRRPQIDGYRTPNHLISRAGFTLSWAPGTLESSQYFPTKYR